MADKKVKVKVDVETNVEESIAGLKALKRQLKDTAAGSAEFKRLANEIDDLEDKIKGSKQGAADWIDTLESAGGPIGAIGGALNKAKVATVSFGTALKATGIGLVVAAIGGLVAAFSESERATKKLQPLLIGLEKILGGIFAAVEPLFDAFINLATKALPYVTKGIGVAYSAITSFLQGLGKLADAVGKLIKGDFTGAWESAKSSVTDFGKRYNEANERFISGTQEVTKTEKKNLEERNKAAEDAAKKREEREAKAKEAAKKAFDEKVARMEAEDKLDEASLKKLKEEALLLAITEQEKLDTEKKFAELAYQQRLKDIEDKKALYAVDSIEYKNLQTEKINEEATYLSQLSGFKDKQKQITDEANKDALEKAKKKAEEERGIQLVALQQQFEDLDAANQRIEFDFEQDLARLAEQKQILADQEAIELQNTELNEFQKTEIRKKYADARKGIVDQEIATEKAAAAAKHEINMAYLGLFEQFGGLLGQLAGKNKALAIAGIVIQQAAAIGQIIASTAIANAKAVAASPLTFGAPWVAINTISAGLSIASTIASAAKSIQQINSQPGAPASNAGASASGGGASMPMAPRAAGASAPQINTTGGQNPSSQIADTIAAASGKPIRAYVVSGEVSSQQALDRRTNRAATFSGQ